MVKVAEAPTHEAGIAPPAKPGYFAVVWYSLLGYLAAGLVLFPIATLSSELGLDPFDESDAITRGIFYRFDVWSYLAELCVGVFVVAITAFLVRRIILEQTNWEVPYGFTFIALFVLGYAPAAAITPLYGVAPAVSLLLAAAVLRWRCEPAGAEPMTFLAAVPRRYRRPAVIALGAAVPAMAVYALAYGATHPLHLGNGSLTGGERSWPQNGLVEHQPGMVRDFYVDVDNDGPFTLRDIELVGIDGSAVFQLERAGIGRPFPARPLAPLDGAAVKPDGDATIILRLRQGAACSGPVAELDGVRLRYEVLGGSFVERLPIKEPPRIRCR